jgi:Na+/proline symporter
MSVGAWMWIFVGAFILFMFYLGYVGAKRAKDSDSWITARKSYSWWQVGLTNVRDISSGALFLGGAGLGYMSGYPVFWYSLFFHWGASAVFFYLAVSLRLCTSREYVHSASISESVINLSFCV